MEPTAHEASEIAEPTNADLKAAFDTHTIEDHAFQAKSLAFNGEILQFKAETEGSLAALHERLGTIATKDDIDEVKQVLKAARVTAGIFTFTFDNASKIGSFVLFAGTIVLLIKYGLFGAIAWIFGKPL
jgi:hypothetical protein